jgi:hypothetical protein
MFSGSGYSMARLRKLSLQSGSEKFKMAAAKPLSTSISVSRQDSEGIPTAIRMFLGSRNSVALLAMLFLGTGSTCNFSFCTR